MQNIEIVEASVDEYKEVAELVTSLLIELEPESTEEFLNMKLDETTRTLLDSSKIWAFLAKSQGKPIGVITLHECAAIYSGGVFGEISELYVRPDFRSLKVGKLLLDSAVEKGNELNWRRLEVGTPPLNESPRTIKFYEDQGFTCTGSRMRRLIQA